MYKNIIFDFDGVIANSIESKTSGFEKLYEPYGKTIQKKVKNYHLENGGVSRYKKITHFHQQYLNIKLNENELIELCNEYSKIIVSEVIKSSYVLGVIDFINKMKKEVKLFISTGTPTEEINFILKKKNLSDNFNGIYGSPESKIRHINQILKTNNFTSADLIFYGDSRSDLEAANYHNIEFVLVKNKHNLIIQKEFLGKMINNFLGLL